MHLAANESVEDVVEESQQFEEELFLNAIRDFYEREFERHQELFNYAAERTDNFRDFGPSVIRDNPNVVKVLRYLVKPPISQMKFGQMSGINSTDSYEKNNPTTPQRETAEGMADFVERNLDERKVSWLHDDVDEDQALEQSREWVCDIIAQSEAKTRYRNWRKDEQEEKVERSMVRAGLEKVERSAAIESNTDIQTGSFVRETKVEVNSGDYQKADFVVRQKDGTLMFIEAKAVGVKIDSYKRIKEIRNKESDWRGAFPDADVGAALSGWIPASKIETLMNDDITIFWEHRLEHLQDHFA